MGKGEGKKGREMKGGGTYSVRHLYHSVHALSWSMSVVIINFPPDPCQVGWTSDIRLPTIPPHLPLLPIFPPFKPSS